jgi:hypothetical protein
MEKIIKKKAMVISIGILIIFFMASFTSTVAFQSVNTSQKYTHSPLFHNRLQTIIAREKNPSFSWTYLGKNQPIELPLPMREILTDEILTQLSSNDIKEYIRLLNSSLLEKWDNILALAKNSLPEINKIIRQDYTDYQKLFNEFSSLPEQDVKALFVETIRTMDCEEVWQYNPSTVQKHSAAINITTGPVCNITSGWFCQITSQPICQITTQPICLVTKGFFCWTIYGPLCKTTGIKCHPPTSRPTLCSIFATAGKILKSIIIVVLLATVIFVPLAIFTLAFITVFNPERCDQMRQKITVWFNCTTPE